MNTDATHLSAALAGRYRIERELGGGGMSRVFLARELGLNREVVIKVLPDDVAAGVSLDRFSREIQLAASLQQANIVPLLAAGDAAGVPYYAMPYVQGESLRGRLSQSPRLTIAECVGILRDVARALSYAHARGVVHRDIKPDNVLLSHGAAVVTDFGIAKAVSASRTMGDMATLTQAGLSLGTPAYMAPEQIAGDANVDHRADLYAWACMAYELFAGEPPFVRASTQRVLAAHLAETPTPLAERRADVPAPLARLVMRCLEKEPAARAATADEVLRDLDGVFTPGESASTPAPARGAGIPGGTAASRWPTRIVGALAIAAVIVFAIVRNRAPATTAAVATADRSIAVMPLANLSGDKADDYFGIGLAEEITRALSKAGVRVIGRVSAGALLAKGLDERSVARQLGVGSLLTGSVQRAAGQIRINVALLSATDGAVQWTEKYDRPIANVFAVQDEIARAVATKLTGSLGRPAGAATTRLETSDPEAYALFLQGQVLFNRRNAQSLAQAIALLERAAARDPQFARAQAMIAMAYAVLPGYRRDSTSVSHERALAAAARAIAMDSTIAESYTAVAWVRSMRAENREADRQFRTALAFDSTVATTWGWYALLAVKRGDFAVAHQRVARARELEPASLIVREWVAQVFLEERRFAAADSAVQQVLALDSTFATAWTDRTSALLGLGREQEAVAFLERHVAALPVTPVVEAHGLLAYAKARAGDLPGARAALDRLRVANGGSLPAMGVVACALDLLGQRDDAIALLRDAIAQPDSWVAILSREARFDRLRTDPRGAALLDKVVAW